MLTSTRSARDGEMCGTQKKRAHAIHNCLHLLASSNGKKQALLKDECHAKMNEARPGAELKKHHNVHSCNVLDVCNANMTDLDTNLQEAVSNYMDIHDWDLLKQSCKLLSSWPKPRPPPIEYHLIKFYFSNSHNFGYCGVAKTLPALLNAYKHVYQFDKKLQSLSGARIEIQFLHTGDLDSPLIPLIEYEKHQHCKKNSAACIHQFSKRNRFDIKEAGDNLPAESTARKMMETELRLYHEEDENGIKKLLVGHGDAAIRWFDGMGPVVDIDLKNLCFKYHEGQGGENVMHEIWLFRDRRGRTVGDDFTLGHDGSWAISNMKADL